jgi:hypothetical protein
MCPAATMREQTASEQLPGGPRVLLARVDMAEGSRRDGTVTGL